MGYLSLYRRYRPQRFADMVGQEHIVRTLHNAIEMNRVAHAYLFSGPRGTGKTTTAKLLAKCLNCADGPAVEPCGECESCRSITNGTSVDVIEIDAASNRGIDEIRDLKERIGYAPSRSRYKVYIIDEVHMLTAEAFNALLKTLEEPPTYAIFVLATTEPHKIPDTIHSRCQRFSFRKLSIDDVAAHLGSILEREGAQYEVEALRMIAAQGEGSVRDSISLLEQCLAYSGDRLTVADVVTVLGITPAELIQQFMGLVESRDFRGIIEFVSRLSDEGKDYRQFLRDAVAACRDVIVRSLGEAPCAAGSARRADRLVDVDRLIYMVSKLSKIELDLKYSSQPAITMEVGLIEMVESIDSLSDVSDDQTVSALSRRVQALERRIGELSRTGLAQAGDHPPRTFDTSACGASARGLELSETATEPGSSEGQTSTGGAHPATSTAAESSDDLLDREAMERLFEDLLAAVKDRKRILHGVMREGKPLAMTKDTLVIGFDPQYKFHMERVLDPKNREIIEDAAAIVCGRPVKIAAQTTDKPLRLPGAVAPGTEAVGMDGASDDAVKAKRPEDDPFVQQALKIFGGRIIR